MWSQEEEHRQLTFPIRVVNGVRTLHDLLRANTFFLSTRSLFFFRPADLFNGDEGLFNWDEFFCFLFFFVILFENRLDETASLDDRDLFFDPVRGVDDPIPATDDDSVGFFFREVSREEMFVVDWDVTARDAAFFGLHVVPASGGLFCDNFATRSDFLVPTDFEAGNE